jgi:seryl-tRNA synthetase
MLSREVIRNHPDVVKRAVALRQDTAPIDEIIELDAEQRRLKGEADDSRAERNAISKRFADRSLNDQERQALRDRATALRDRIGEIERRVDELEQNLHELELWVPNIPDPSVPVGETEEDNVVRWSWGEPRKFDFEPRSHADLGEALGVFDPADAVRMSGTRFYALKGAAARMERALAAFMLDVHTREHGFTQVWIPYVVKAEAMVVAAQLPKFAGDTYHIEAEDSYLIPTAEVALVNMETGKILEKDDLPILYAADSPCFRLEAGAAGRDTRGMIRVHQFDKVEMVIFCEPEESMTWLERLVTFAETVLQRLELPYHVLEMNTSDLGFGQVKKYDPEVWMPSQNKYVEVSSCSNMGDFQARRGRIRYRPAPGEPARLVHTLNGSGVAVGRCLAAIWENYQREDGTIQIPHALIPYIGGLTEITGP